MVLAVSIRISRVPTYSGYHFYYTTLHVQDFHPLWSDFPEMFHFLLYNIVSGPSTPMSPKRHRFGLFPVRSPLLRESLNCFIFLRVLRCFSSPRSPPYLYGFPAFSREGSPIRIPADISDICSSPQLFAACHVLLRL